MPPPSAALVHWNEGALKGIRSEANVSQEYTMPNYACSAGAACQGDLIIDVETPLISDDLKPPYSDGNSERPRERDRDDEVIKVGMD